MYKFILKAGDANTRTYSWNAAYKFPSAVAPLTSGTVTSGAFDIITFIGGASNTLIFEGGLGMFGNSGGGAGAGDGSKSLRFRNGAYMTRTPGTAGIKANGLLAHGSRTAGLLLITAFCGGH